MKEWADTLQAVVMVAGVVVLAAITIGTFLYAMRDVPRKITTFIGSWFVGLLLVVGVVWYGGSKSMTFDAGLRDNGSWVSNNTVHVAWTYTGIPSASTLYIAYRESGTTNKWADLGETVVSALVWEGTLANATNYDYLVYTTYVPPSPVHTNGVWVGPVYETKKRQGAQSFIVINGVIREHGKAIAPPNAKRKEEEDEE